MNERTGCHGCVYAQCDSDGCICKIDGMLVWNPAKGCKYRKPENCNGGSIMTSNEKKFLNELAKLLSSYAIEEVRCEERDGSKNIVFYSNGIHPAVQRCRNCKHCAYRGIEKDVYCMYHDRFISRGSEGYCSDWEPKSIEPAVNANIYHTTEDDHSVYWCGWCGHICSVNDKYCSDCGAEFGEVIEV